MSGVEVSPHRGYGLCATPPPSFAPKVRDKSCILDGFND